MDIWVLDTTLTPVKTFDSFESMIWTERYQEYGDFEIYSLVDLEALSYLKIGNYLWRKDSDRVMIIESIELKSSVDEGNHMKINGRSLESILDRRIVWSQTNISGNLQTGIQKLINEAIISPTDIKRKIANFTFKASTDEAVTSLNGNHQFTGDNLYEVINKLCVVYGLGFRVLLTEDNKFEFSLYSGTIRDYSQEKNPYVVFSNKFDNLLNSDYLESDSKLKTIALVAGEGEGEERKTLTTTRTKEAENYTGLNRRELYVDARDLSSDDPEDFEKKIPEEEYNEMLRSRGLEYLEDYTVVKSFEGDVNPDSMFVYGKDYFLGDIVQIKDGFGIEERVRISELVRSEDIQTGITTYPTFVVIDEEEVD